MTVQDLLYDARSLLDDYNSGGTILAESETAETDTNALRYINMGINKAYPYARYYKTHTITQVPTPAQKEAERWILYTLPSDFGQLDKIVLDDTKYILDHTVQLEGYNTLYLSYEFEGTVRVVYMPRPVRLVNMTDTILINNPLAEQFLVYYVAAKIALTDLPDQANFFESESLELLKMAAKPQPAQELPIINVY